MPGTTLRPPEHESTLHRARVGHNVELGLELEALVQSAAEFCEDDLQVLVAPDRFHHRDGVDVQPFEGVDEFGRQINFGKLTEPRFAWRWVPRGHSRFEF